MTYRIVFNFKQNFIFNFTFLKNKVLYFLDFLFIPFINTIFHLL